MAKQAGLGDNFYLAGYDLSGDIGSIEGGGGPQALENTGIDKSAIERIGGLRDGRLSWSAWFNDGDGQAHPVLSTLPTTDRIATYCRGTTLGNPAACLVAKQLNYDPKRAGDGALTIDVEAVANAYGLEWGRLGTAGKRTDTGATNGASVDFGTGSTSYGLQAYLHVFSFSGTDVTIKLQESSDNGSVDSFADVTGGAFTEVTSGPTAERIATASDQTVERYLRVVTATTGGFTSCVFAVVICRNDTAVSF